MARKEEKKSLGKRLLISTAILAFIRIGALLPIPEIDHEQLTFYFQTHAVTGGVTDTHLLIQPKAL